MRVKLHAFPVVYFTVKCVKHDCWVAVRPQMSTEQTDTHIVGAQITAMECRIGGEPSKSNCSHTWEMSVSAPGDITIVR